VERRSLSDLSPISHEHVPSELIPLIDAVNSAFARIDKSARQQQQFVSDAAHELRTPLTALALQVGNLASSRQGQENDERIAELQKGVRRASKVTAQLLQLARHDMKPERQAPEPVDLADTVHQVVAGLVPLATDRGVDLGILDVSPAILSGSQQDLSVLMECLIDNAVRYTPAGGSVDVSLQVADDTARLIVSDTGPGLAEDQLEKVFERFYRGTRTDETGTGLGLAIVKSIATQNAWQVRLSNRADRSGLEAMVEFPLA
jgi:two-component system OmpR family sensor kinase